MESDTSPVKPTVIDLDPDDVTGDTQRDTVAPPPVKTAKAAGSRLLPAVVAALVIGGVVGGLTSSSLTVGNVVFQTATGAMKSRLRLAPGDTKLRDVPQGTVAGSGQRVSWRELVQ